MANTPTVSRDALSIMDEIRQLGDAHPGTLYQFGNRVSAHQFVKLYRLVDQYVSPGSKVLDWGAGAGHFSYFLSRLGHHTTSYIFGEKIFQPLLDRPNINVIQANVNEPVLLPFEAESFDAVVSVGVLEHVRESGGNEAASLAEIRRILKPGGHFLCYHFPNYFSIIEFIAQFVPNQHHHEYRYRPADISHLVKNANLDLLESVRYGFLPRNSLGKLTKKLGNGDGLARLWGLLDGFGEAFLPIFCQNHYFVAQRPSSKAT